MFGFKRTAPIHRDEAATAFMEHCRKEASTLLAATVPPLRAFCDGRDGRPEFDDVMSRPVVRFEASHFKANSAEQGLIASHCLAITTATGLDALYPHIDPSHQAKVMEWTIYERIVQDDVGRDNIGKPPSPLRRSKPSSNGRAIHVQWSPGTFEHGLPSLQKQLTDRYDGLSASQKVVVLLLALKVFQPQRGISRVVYHECNIGDGVVTLNPIGGAQLDPNDLDEWQDELEITDAVAALSGLAPDLVNPIILAVEAVDPFWPTYCASYRLTWT
jgi:hypothetical protein